MKIQKQYFFNFIILMLFCSIGTPNTIIAQQLNIKNDVFWNTKDGLPLNSQGGGIFKFADPVTGAQKYYWYGVQYVEANRYRENPAVTLNTSTFEAVTCYSSTDLVNWTFERNVLTKDKVNPSGKSWVGRLGVCYIKELKKYAMFVQHDTEVLITLADSPTAEFSWHQKINMEKMIGTSNTGDQTVFTDEDTGKSYLIYCYGKGRDKIYVSEIGLKDGKVNLLDCTPVFKGESREGNCMFKYQNKYYMFASNIYGWDASFAYYLVADDIRGPYLPTNQMSVMKGAEEDFAHISQTGFFFSVKGSQKETIVYCGDRWADFAGNGLGYNQWCPISFEEKTPYFNSLNSWNLDAKTGNWKVAEDNNYVKNGSFEADRRHIPSPVKPVQIQLTGWASEVTEGNKIGLDSINSPVLNHFNTEKERKIVIGEKSLNISDKVSFKRKTFQIISSSPYVKLGDGLYTLTAKIKNSSGFIKLEMYALSNSKTYKNTIRDENSDWKTITIKNIAVKEGKVEIGFIAEGKANSFCFIDDVCLVRSKK
ncbi:Glycosyl hydrolases family 43 [Flavobacterium aquidurense]|uniref:Beta-xylosidase n=1 Tax=Flavobacterium frigidimaris TaxID=262320 RepID=A0ABX4BJS9_FLAFR|nr:family 43 glycosylhydrolase [Flavobacterium frigidimaris]OXA75747.1 beta-xylosidase [Flavobacterium frigidimaris]SDZ63897.1 Glycosyl hydrolases family 43 [Flavobacterium aquidurense]